MLIKYTKGTGNLFEDNKKRIDDIKSAIKVFDIKNLSKMILGENKEFKTYLENEMFFEIISQVEVDNLLQIYNNAAYKNEMLKDLELEYRNRGHKGFFMCWHFVLNQYKVGQVNF